MNCPKCNTALAQKRFKGRETDVDYCAKCQGVWFDDGELSSIIGVRARNHAPAPTARPSALSCPRCAKPLVLFPYPGTMTVIDGCRTCRGVWLDGGEFQELAKLRREPESAAAARPRPRPQAPSVPAAVEIPGVKGQMIRFIDRTIEALWASIRA